MLAEFVQYGSGAPMPILEFPQKVQHRFLQYIPSNALIGTVIGEVVATWALFEDATAAVGPCDGSDLRRIPGREGQCFCRFLPGERMLL